MNTIPLAALATSALIGLGLAAPATAVTATAGQTARAAAADTTTTTTRERGIVVECTGYLRGPVDATLYENNHHGNEITVHVGRDGDEVGANRWTEQKFLVQRQVDGRLRLDGRRARITGTAVAVGQRVPVHEEYDDAGTHITSDGYHRRLRTDLRLTWGRRSAPLTCDNAFRYDLQVTREQAG